MEIINRSDDIRNGISTYDSATWRYDIEKNQFHISLNVKVILETEESEINLFDLIASITAPEYARDFEEFVKKALQIKGNYKVHLMIKTKSRTKWISIRALHQSTGVINGLIEDISAKKKLQALNNLKTNLGSKIEKITNTGLFQWEVKDDFLICSDNFFKITQLNNKNGDNRLSKYSFLAIIEPFEKSFVLEVMHECLTLNKEFELSFHIYGGSKKKKLKLYGYPEQGFRGKKLFGVLEDISNEDLTLESIIIGQDSERKRISLELHDSVGQKLIAVKYMLELIKISKDFDHLNNLTETMNDVITEVRNITHNLSLQIVSELGLKNSLEYLLNECCNAINASAHFRYDISESTQISGDTEKIIYRIAQEALSNTMKHSGAKEIKLNLKHQNKQLHLIIVDNGIGFDINKKKGAGIGIQNIKQRVNLLDGFFSINSTPKTGTEIKVKIPIDHK